MERKRFARGAALLLALAIPALAGCSGSDGQGGWLGVFRVAEPATLGLLLPGAVAVFWTARRRRAGP